MKNNLFKFNYDLTDLHKYVKGEFLEVKKKFPELVSMYYESASHNILIITEHELTEEKKKEMLIYFEIEGADCIKFEVRTKCSYE